MKVMDKDLILIVGGALVAAVVLHGMWLTWRARRDRLPMQLATDVPEAKYEDADVLGPARVVSSVADQASLGLWSSEDGRKDRAPVVTATPAAVEEEANGGAGADRPPIVAVEPAPADPLAVAAIVPDDSAPPATRGEEAVALRAAPPVEAVGDEFQTADVAEDALVAESAGAVDETDVEETEALAALEAVPAVAVAGAGMLRAGVVPAMADGADPGPPDPTPGADRPDVDAGQPDAPSHVAPSHVAPSHAETALAGSDGGAPGTNGANEANGRDRAPRERTSGWRSEPRDSAPVDGQGEEIFVINVLARHGDAFNGADLFEVFMRNTLKFRDMNIFHRLDPATGGVRFSVANAVEPGIFDLSDMASLETPGVSLFFRLPGPDQPGEVLDDMLGVARDIGKSLGGDLKDENMSVLTGQTLSHFKQRMAEFSRKRMSMRAAHG